MGGKLARLTEPQKKRLRAWLSTPGVSYSEVQQRVKSDFHISISAGALSGFWRRHCVNIPRQPRAQRIHLILELRCDRPVSVLLKR